jgi:hypothetical protein
MDITAAGMEYFNKLLDTGDSALSQQQESMLREALDWVEQNPDVKSAEDLVKRRRGWLTSSEFVMLSGAFTDEELAVELSEFKQALVGLQQKGMVV